jgi:hypothetical protein
VRYRGFVPPRHHGAAALAGEAGTCALQDLGGGFFYAPLARLDIYPGNWMIIRTPVPYYPMVGVEVLIITQ